MLMVVPAQLGDALWVGTHLREEDRMEVEAATGSCPVAVLRQSYALSRECRAVFRWGPTNPCAIFGVSDDPTMEGLGIVWMLCTPEIEKVSLEVMRESRRWIERMAALYTLGLHNLAWSRNYLHVRWCQHLGFVELGTQQLNGQTFIHIYRPNYVRPDSHCHRLPSDSDRECGG